MKKLISTIILSSHLFALTNKIEGSRGDAAEAFLCASHPRLGGHSPAQRLDQALFRHIADLVLASTPISTDNLTPARVTEIANYFTRGRAPSNDCLTPEIIKSLAGHSKGIDFFVDENGKTFLRLAVEVYHQNPDLIGLIRCLLANRANPDKYANDHKSPMSAATSWDHRELVRIMGIPDYGQGY